MLNVINLMHTVIQRWNVALLHKEQSGMGHGLFAALELAEMGPLYSEMTGDGGLEFRWNISAEVHVLHYRSTRCCFQPPLSIAFIDAHLVHVRQGITNGIHPRGMLSASNWQGFNGVTSLCHIWWLEQGALGRTGGLGGWWSVELGVPAVTGLGCCCSKSLLFIWQAWIRRREESSIAIQLYYFYCLFSVLVFPFFLLYWFSYYFSSHVGSIFYTSTRWWALICQKMAWLGLLRLLHVCFTPPCLFPGALTWEMNFIPMPNTVPIVEF